MTPIVEEIIPAPDPAGSCASLDGLSYRLFLDSSRAGTRFGRYSFLTADPAAVVRSRGVETECLDRIAGTHRVIAGDGLVVLRQLVAPHSAGPVPGLPPFQGGAAGYVGYDWGLTLERLPTPCYDDLGLHDLVMGLYDWVLAWDHESSRAWLISTGIPERTVDARHARAASRMTAVKRWLAVPSDRTVAPSDRTVAPSHPRTFAPFYPVDRVWWPASFDLKSSFTRAGYLAAVERV